MHTNSNQHFPGNVTMDLPIRGKESDPWKAPQKAMGLVSRFNVEVLKPARTLLAIVRDERKQREDKLASEKEAAEQIQEQRVKNLDTDLNKLRSTLSSVRSRGSDHLNKHKISHSVPPPLPGEGAKLTGGTEDEKHLHDGIQQAAQQASTQSQDAERLLEGTLLKSNRPDNPVFHGAGCGVAIGALIAWPIVGAITGSGTVGFFFGVVGYFIVAYLFYSTPTNTMTEAWTQILYLERRARSSLETASNLSAKLRLQVLDGVKMNHEAVREQARKDERTRLDQLQARLQPIAAEIAEQASHLAAMENWACLPWNDNEWSAWNPASKPTFCAAFGGHRPTVADISTEFSKIGFDFHVPAFFPFDEGKGIMVEASGSAKQTAASMAEGFAMRLLAVIPPGKARFTFLDPVGLGNSVASLMSLADHDDMLVNSRAWSEPQHIEQRLGEITEHMETVIQKYLRQDYKTIHEYNEHAGEVAEPHRFVVVFDFPTNFNETSARRLVSIAQNGPRCGVYPIVLVDMSKPLPYGFSLEELERHTQVITWKDKHFRLQNDLFDSWDISLDKPPSPDKANPIKTTVGKQAKDAARVEVPYDRLLQLAGLNQGHDWTVSTARKIEVPLGPEGARKARQMTFGEGTAHHGLIVGKTGSGKSNLMNIIISTLALKYSPEELQLYLIDFKQGVEFKPYAEHKLPHAFAIAVESEREFALSVMDRLEQELKHRGDLFRSVGAANIADYRTKVGDNGAALPRIVLLVDEFQEFFREDDDLSRRVSAILNQLVLQGRSNGLHVLLGTQSLANVHGLTRGTFDQMGVRIALQCSEADSRLILADDNPAARLLSRPGEAIYNDQGGLIEGNKPFQVAMFSEDDRETVLAGIRERALAAAAEHGRVVRTPIVFAGNELAHIESNCAISDLLHNAPASSNARSLNLWVGEPVAIRPTVCARLTRQAGNHMLVIARHEEEGAGIALAALVSALAQRNPEDLRIVVANFLTPETPVAALVEQLPALYPNSIKLVVKQRDLAAEVRALADEVKRRGNSSSGGPTILVFLLGLQRMRILREDDDSQSYEDTNDLPCAFFGQMVKEGAEAGIHIIAACDTLGNAARCFERRLMNQVGLRIGTAMGEADSSTFLDSPAAAKLDKPHRALFFDESRPGLLEKFIPFDLPQYSFLEEVSTALRSRKQPMP